MDNAFVQKIKAHEWDNRVQRPGFLLPKSIINWAEVQPFQLTTSVTLTYDNVCWVNTSNLYDGKRTREFIPLLQKAFAEDKNFPLELVERLDRISNDVRLFIEKLKQQSADASFDELGPLFSEYIRLLYRVQHFYVVAVPLTNYCESVLEEQGIKYVPYAYPYKELDVDFLEQSLRNLVDTPSDSVIAAHCKQFAWIKTNYNIITPYTEEDVLRSLQSQTAIHKKETSDIENEYLTGLQVGIYIRNRIKELSQQLWFYIDPVVQGLSQHCSITRDMFLYHTQEEIEMLLKIGESQISKSELQTRKNGFVVGIFERESFLFTGDVVDELYHFFNDIDDDTAEVVGRVACKGVVRGTVRVIKNPADFERLKQGDILVTSMTTPDFVVIMKRAGAIVTDEGGLSCHAAIVSRELGVPCVIGTKVATKVLGDGEIVEVDADRGVVIRV